MSREFISQSFGWDPSDLVFFFRGVADVCLIIVTSSNRFPSEANGTHLS